jgi:hypothetical protein
MNIELTLQLDTELVHKAEEYARQHDTTLSTLVSAYLNYLLIEVKTEEPNVASLPPITRSLLGRFGKTEIDEEDYDRHRIEKHQ